MPKPKKTNQTIANLDKAINEQSVKMQNSVNNKDYNPLLDELYLARLFHVRNSNAIDCLDSNIFSLIHEFKETNKALEEIKELLTQKPKKWWEIWK